MSVLSSIFSADVMRVVAIDDGYDAYDQETKLIEAQGAKFFLRPCKGDTSRVLKAVADADVVLVRETPMPAIVIAEMDRCKAIIRYGIGVDNIDQDAARKRQIMVANVPDYGIDEVSSQAVALALSVSRHILVHDRDVRSGRWSTGVTAPMYRWRGRTLGLIGYGRIARMTHEKLAGFGFDRVLVHDPSAVFPVGVQQASVDEICAQADLISLHAPLTSSTRHLINAERLSLMRATAILINTARGGLIDLDALATTLLEKKILGAGLDVFDPEPPDISHPIFGLNNVVVTNHIGWYSQEAMRDLQRKAAEEAVRVLCGHPPKNWLNPW